MDYSQMSDAELSAALEAAANAAQEKRAEALAIRKVMNQRTGAAKAKATAADLSDDERAALLNELQAR